MRGLSDRALNNDHFTGGIVLAIQGDGRQLIAIRLDRGLDRIVLVVILVACRMDMLLGVNYIRDAACIAFIVNELISMVENFGLMGVPFPEPIKEAIELLQKKGEKQ